MPSLGAAISVGVVPGGGGEERDVVELTNPAAPSSTSLEMSTECSCSNFILISLSSLSFCWRDYNEYTNNNDRRGRRTMGREEIDEKDGRDS